MARRKVNPKVKGMVCAICGRPAQSYCHIEHRGMGGDPTDQRTDGFASCGYDHSDPTTCHGAVGQHMMRVRRADDDSLRFTCGEVYSARLRRRGLVVRDGIECAARYENRLWEEVGDEPY